MHELSIALSIADLAMDRAREAGADRIMAIELDIGALSGVEVSALDSAMEIAFKDTLLEKADIKVNRIEPQCECLDCGNRFSADDLSINCPSCGKNNYRFSKGMELQLSSLLIE